MSKRPTEEELGIAETPEEAAIAERPQVQDDSLPLDTEDEPSLVQAKPETEAEKAAKHAQDPLTGKFVAKDKVAAAERRLGAYPARIPGRRHQPTSRSGGRRTCWWARRCPWVGTLTATSST